MNKKALNQNILASALYTVYRESKGGGKSGLKTWHDVAQPGPDSTEFLAWLNIAVTAKRLLGVSDETDGPLTHMLQ